MKPRAHPAPRGMRGQALAEGAVALAALAALFWAVPWTGRYLDLSLTVAHASHLAAMQATRTASPELALDTWQSTDLAAPGLRWHAPDGTPILGAVGRGMERHAAHAGFEPGAADAASQSLRADWGAPHTGVHVARVQASVRAPLSGDRLVLRRASAVMVGAGHASDDAQAQQRVARGSAGWARAAARSAAAAAPLVEPAALADGGWSRPRGTLEWLDAWAGLVPAAHLQGGRP